MEDITGNEKVIAGTNTSNAQGCSHDLTNLISSEASARVDSMGLLQQALSGVTSVYWCDCLIEQQSIRGGTSIQPISISVPLAIFSSLNVCVRRGYYTAGDGGGGVFVWTQDTTTPQSTDPMGALLVVPNGHRTGCWKRLYTGPINVKWFGAKGNADTSTPDDDASTANDDTESIQEALNLADSTGGAIYIPKGTYLTTKTLTIKSGSVISGDGWASIILFIPKEESPCMLINAVNGYNWTLIEDLSIQTFSSISTAGIQVDGVSTSIRNVYIEGTIKGSVGFRIAGILISESVMVSIEDCSIAECYGDGIKLGGNNPSYGIYIGPHNSIHWNRGYGINCGIFGNYQSSEVHIFENDVEANNYNFPEARYQITGCIGPGSIRSNHLESTDTPWYLFSWDKVQEKGIDKLADVLKEKYNIDWIKNAKVERIDNMTVVVYTEKKSLLLKLNDNKTEVILEIGNIKIDNYRAKLENNELKIYESPGSRRALINLGPYCRAVVVENNNFVGPDDYAIIANFGTWPGLTIKSNSFSAGSIANIWLQAVQGCIIEGNGHWGTGKPVKIDSAAGLRLGLSACHETRYINERQDVQLNLMDDIVYVSIGGITVTLPDPTPLYTYSKQYIVKNVSKSDITVTAPVAIDGAPSITITPNQAVTFGSYYGPETEEWVMQYCILGKTM